MIELRAKSEMEAKAEAVALSSANPGQYVIAWALFSTAYASIKPRLNVYAPTDSSFGWYALNGKAKKFSQRQIIADQNATPMMS